MQNNHVCLLESKKFVPPDLNTYYFSKEEKSLFFSFVKQRLYWGKCEIYSLKWWDNVKKEAVFRRENVKTDKI